MTDPASQPSSKVFAEAALVRLVTIDELATLRHIHTMSIRRLAASHLSELELLAFCDYINSEEYAARLAEQVRNGRLHCATLMDEIVATGGWVPASDNGANARLMSVFVSPLYALNGLGRLIVQSVEANAVQAGFQVFTIRAPIGSLEFFGKLGYEVASHGVWTVRPEQPMPVGFMRKTMQRPKVVLPGKSGLH